MRVTVQTSTLVFSLLRAGNYQLSVAGSSASSLLRQVGSFLSQWLVWSLGVVKFGTVWSVWGEDIVD